MNNTSDNTINHKCPCCGYTTEFDCWRKNDKGEFETVTIQGDESLLKAVSLTLMLLELIQKEKLIGVLLFMKKFYF